MNQPNILELIKNCDVEWKPLGKVCDINKGKQLNKTLLLEQGKYPAYNGGKSHSGYTNEFNVDANTIIISQGGASAGFVNFITCKFWANAHCYYLIPNKDLVNNKFLYYFLKMNEEFFMTSQHGAGIPALSSSKLSNFEIPLPSLEVQQKIVKILDKFTELEATLEAELTLRKKQYEFYRNQLLTFDNNSDRGGNWFFQSRNPLSGSLKVEWKTLGEVSLDFGRGKSKHRPRNDTRLYGGTIPFVQTGDIKNCGHILENYSQTYSELGLQQSKLWKKGTLCITIAANIAETAILGFDACFPDSVIGFVANPKETTTDYVEYLLSAWKNKLQNKSMGSAQENINLSTFENMLFPFPDLETQAQIVAILDKFDTLTQSISDGLPREIELRRKQYEYYREQLLNFNH